MDVEWTMRDNDSMARDDEMMIELNDIDLASANAMELKRFRATAEAHASDEMMKNQWDYQLIERGTLAQRADGSTYDIDSGAQLNAGKTRRRAEVEM